jgi:hypothetical protein
VGGRGLWDTLESLNPDINCRIKLYAMDLLFKFMSCDIRLYCVHTRHLGSSFMDHEDGGKVSLQSRQHNAVFLSLSFSCFPYFLLNLTFRFPTILLPTVLLDLHTVLPISDLHVFLFYLSLALRAPCCHASPPAPSIDSARPFAAVPCVLLSCVKPLSPDWRASLPLRLP